MNILKAINELKKQVATIDPLYLSKHSLKEWDNYYMNTIKPLEEKAREILIINAGIEPTKTNIDLVHHFMSEDNYGSPLETLVKSPVSFAGGCKVGSTPDNNLRSYINEIELIKENQLNK